MKILNKREGETPLQALHRLRERLPELKNERLSYAGRLDPMASGVMLVLEGTENSERSRHLALDKTYEVDILFGVSTDTHDILGVLDSIKTEATYLNPAVLNLFMGKQVQEYPLYSSKTVNGIQLHTHARRGTTPLTIPTHEVEIYALDFLKKSTLSGEQLATVACQRILPLVGDFRQNEIIHGWETFKEKHPRTEFEIWSVRVHCSSGTYMRILSRDIGRKMNYPALAWKIRRTRIGVHTSPVTVD